MTKTPPAPVARDFPLLYKPRLIWAFIARRKTMTRRDLRPQPEYRENDWWWKGHAWHAGDNADAWRRVYAHHVGDRMYAREAVWRDDRDEGVVIYAATPEIGRYEPATMRGDDNGLVRSSYPDSDRTHTLPTRDEMQAEMEANVHWRLHPSIHMPRWASRVSAKLAAVDFQRVSAITESDAIAEGVVLADDDSARAHALPHRAAFLKLYHEINNLPVAADPWVAVLTLSDVVIEEPAR